MEELYPLKETYHSEPRKSQISEYSLGLFFGDEILDFKIAKELKENEWSSLCKKHNWYYIKKYPL